MSDPDLVTDLLALRAMPRAAAALRARTEVILERWNAAVKRHLPDADPLTAKQVRNSIPLVLEKIAAALESAEPRDTEVLTEVGQSHGFTRSQQHYDVNELLVEYRLLRRIVLEELLAAGEGRLGGAEIVAVDIGIDIALQRGVAAFVEVQNTQLRAAAAAESKYLTFLSHDLRNNLNGVTLMLDVLSMRLGTLPEFREELEDVDSLRRSVAETIEGMDRLLQAERLRKDAVTLKLGPVDLPALADDLLAQVARRAQEKGLRLVNAVPRGCAVHSDRELLTLVLQNLIGNAIKYSASGAVTVGAGEDPDGWFVYVRDEGPGIAPEQQDTLFAAFTRGETHGQSGVGLGLTIASHAARLLGTELAVKSTPGRGATFGLPLTPAEKAEVR